MLERLWSSWRASYVTGAPTRADGDGTKDGTKDDTKSVFTRILESDLPDSETHVVHRGPTCFALLNAFPYAPGHLLVLPYRQVVDLVDLTDEETTELWATVADAVAAVRRAYDPEGLNVGLNLGRPAGGSVPNHLHVHVVPRWIGDSNFMTAIGNTQTLPESLASSADKLRRAWQQQP